MKIQVLVDNNTYIDQYYLGEPAVSYYVEIDDKKILFDAGYSEIFLYNAAKMNIDLSKITHIVLSHGHNDHTRGMKYLKEKYDLSSIELIAHPDCFNAKLDMNDDIGSPFSSEVIGQICKFNPQKNPFKISDNCIFLGEVPTINKFENRQKIGLHKVGNSWADDYVIDDSALACKTKDGIFIITGCSHSGICNILEYAKNVCNDNRILGILGGFHLFELNERLEQTIQYLQAQKISQLYPSHCVSFKSKAKMNETLTVNEVGVGLSIIL